MSLPERLGRLRRVQRIGAGGFATVWLYHDDELDSPVAVKALADNWAQRDDVVDRFLEEARILRRADSDHVVRVYDIGSVDQTPYFVMSYADRGSLADLGEPGVPVAPERVVELVSQAGEGLAVLHRHGVIHRDIKPQNILLSSTPGGGERVLIADLGVAKAMLHASGLTQVVGTPAYMAPEQANGVGIDLRADVHALGAVAYHLMTGRYVREGGISSLANPVPPPPPTSLVPVSPAYDDVLLRALATDPEDRWPDVPSFTAALRRASESARPAEADRAPAPGAPPSDAATVIRPVSGDPLDAGPVTPVTPVTPDAPDAPAEPDEPRKKGGAVGIVATVLVVLAVLLVAFGASYGITRLVAGDDDPGQGPSGSTPGPGSTPSYAADIDFAALAEPAGFDQHIVIGAERSWSYPVPRGWVPYFTSDAKRDEVVPDAQVDDQAQVRWRPAGEPVEGGYSLRYLAVGKGGTPQQRAARKRVAFQKSTEIEDFVVMPSGDDQLWFTYRDDNDRLRYDYFQWFAAGDGEQAGLEVSISGRRVDEAAMGPVLASVANGVAPLGAS